MIACVSPGFSSANHTINTLRYSDRLKEKTYQMKKVQENNFFKVNNNNNNKNNENYDIYDVNFFNFKLEDDLQKLELDPTPQLNVQPSLQTSPEKKKKEIEIIESSSKRTSALENNWDYLPESSDYIDDGYPQSHREENTKNSISNEFINFKNDLNSKIIEQEEEIITTHIQIIKDDAKLLTEEGELISSIKGINNDETDFLMEDYIRNLDQIINKKISIYMDLKKKMEIYKQTLNEDGKINK